MSDNNSAPETQEDKIKKLYGKLPSRGDLLNKTLNRSLQDRKYFDSGDYALSQAGRKPSNALDGPLGSKHPEPENIPRPSTSHSPPTGQADNHVREPSNLSLQ